MAVRGRGNKGDWREERNQGRRGEVEGGNERGVEFPTSSIHCA